MKKGVSLILTFIMVLGIFTSVPVTVNAVWDLIDLTFELNEDETGYIITDCNFFVDGDMNLPDEYNGLPIVEIGNNAFEDCIDITSITIPDSITNIGEDAFKNCYKLSSIEIPNNVTEIGAFAFSGCSSLVSVELPNKLKSIERYVFYMCTDLSSITFPNNVTSIGDYAFAYCDSLTSVILPDSITTIGISSFTSCVGLKSLTIPDSVTTIGNSAFSNCEKLESITIGNNVTNIGDNTFYRCFDLSTVKVFCESAILGEDAFKYCDNISGVYIDSLVKWSSISFKNEYANPLKYAKNLYLNEEIVTSLVIPDSITTIGDYAYVNCTSITSVTIPDSVSSIGRNAFLGCEQLTEVHINDISKWCNIYFDTAYSNPLYYALNLYLDNSLIENIIIPDNVKNLGKFVFRNCKNISSVVISDKVTSIGFGAFAYCENIKSLVLGNNVTEIGNQAFRDCTSLTSIIIPDSVTSIGSYAFYNCENIVELNLGKSLTSIGESAFKDCEKIIEVKIPKSVIDIASKALGYFTNSATDNLEKVENFTIHGYKNTIAETYANTNGFIFIETSEKCEHKTTKWVTDKKATVNVAGKKHKECTECGEVLKTTKIAQLKCLKPKLSKIENTADGVKITWGKVSGADSYAVYRKVKGGSYSKIATVKGNSKVAYTDKKASSGKKYYYYIKAVNEAGSSDSSSSKSITYLADPTLKTPSSTKKGIILKWSKVSGADGYMVYRKTGSGSYSKIATVKGSSKVTYTDKKAKKGKTYTYKIKAYKSKTYSAYSNSKKIKDKY